MNDVVEIRVDDRLIHGQVAGLWTNSLKASRIMVVDDEVAANETQKSLLRMAAPGSVNTSIISVEKAVDNLANNRYAGQRVFIVVKSPVTIKRMVDQGLPIQKFNLGNLSAKDNTTVLSSGISVTAEENQALKDMKAQGIHFYKMWTPTDSETPVETY